ncbi:MAG: ABC transporter ATP-binding protein [Patescibacteria group bacterium]|jgi:ABC-type lipoprotein export system ATPase subunit
MTEKRGTHPIPQMVVFNKVTKTYGTGDIATHALQDASFTIEAGSFTAIVGPSGSGKSTMLNILGLLDRPTSGTYTLDGKLVSDLTSDTERARVRRELIGFVFQQFNLLPKASALENVMMPGVYTRLANRRKRAEALLKLVGLGHRLHNRPNQLSGGEQQRVAIARALINEPKVILADEPTGNLDSKTGVQVLDLLKELNREGHTLIVVTHDEGLATHADTVITMKDGRIQ